MNQKIVNIGLNQQNSALIGEVVDKNSAINDLRLQQIYSNNGKKDRGRANALEREVADKELDAQIAANEAAAYKGMVADLQLKIAKKDVLILEWMHSNEAFKQLARQYGKELGMTDDQRNVALSKKLIDVAEEDPKFANTKIGNEAKLDIKQRADK